MKEVTSYKGVTIKNLRLKNGGTLIVVLLREEVKNKKYFRKIFFHEIRHAVDYIIEEKKLSFSDRENSACLHSFIEEYFYEKIIEKIEEA